MEGSVYIKARREWDERYADLVLGKRNWQPRRPVVCRAASKLRGPRRF